MDRTQSIKTLAIALHNTAQSLEQGASLDPRGSDFGGLKSLFLSRAAELHKKAAEIEAGLYFPERPEAKSQPIAPPHR